MSFPNGVRLSDSIASKLIEGGFPVNLDGLRFNAALNIWEFVPFGGGGGTTHVWSLSLGRDDPANALEWNSLVGGQNVFAVNELNVIQVLGRIATFSRIGIDVQANSQIVDGALQFRVNQISVNQSAVITAGLTGFFVDAVNTDTIAVGDEVSCQLETDDPGLNLDLFSLTIEFL